MNEELYFNNELCKCLNAVGLSDCGENDAWNYWYQRVHMAHDAAVDSVTETQRAENAKLRELVRDMLDVMLDYRCDIRMPNSLDYSNEPAVFKERARELGVDVD